LLAGISLSGTSIGGRREAGAKETLSPFHLKTQDVGVFIFLCKKEKGDEGVNGRLRGCGVSVLL